MLDAKSACLLVVVSSAARLQPLKLGQVRLGLGQDQCEAGFTASPVSRIGCPELWDFNALGSGDQIVAAAVAF